MFKLLERAVLLFPGTHDPASFFLSGKQCCDHNRILTPIKAGTRPFEVIMCGSAAQADVHLPVHDNVFVVVFRL